MRAAIALFAQETRELPEWLGGPFIFNLTVGQWLGLAIIAAVASVIGTVLQWLLVRIGRVVSGRTSSDLDNNIVELLPGPLRILMALLVFDLLVPILRLPPAAESVLDILVRTVLIAAVILLFLRLVTVAGKALESRLTGQTQDESKRRAIRTQIAVPVSILRVMIVVLGVALVLYQFEVVRSVGVSLLASAGIAGVVIGLAAQKAVANLLAGIQVAIFQPVKIGDAVVVEGEWGWVEEIGLTHAVVKIWDLRRLILPVNYFVDKPFQNWTRETSELLGTVILYVDYTISVDAVRAELQDIVRDHPLWNKAAQGVHVTELTSDRVQLRVLVSADDGGKLWDLRCHVRERLLAWLQGRGKTALPRNRVAVLNSDGDSEGADAAAG